MRVKEQKACSHVREKKKKTAFLVQHEPRQGNNPELHKLLRWDWKWGIWWMTGNPVMFCQSRTQAQHTSSLSDWYINCVDTHACIHGYQILLYWVLLHWFSIFLCNKVNLKVWRIRQIWLLIIVEKQISTKKVNSIIMKKLVGGGGGGHIQLKYKLPSSLSLSWIIRMKNDNYNVFFFSAECPRQITRKEPKKESTFSRLFSELIFWQMTLTIK